MTPDTIYDAGRNLGVFAMAAIVGWQWWEIRRLRKAYEADLKREKGVATRLRYMIDGLSKERAAFLFSLIEIRNITATGKSGTARRVHRIASAAFEGDKQ